jgi:DNA polymerase-4
MKNKLIFHVDANSAYLSWSAVDRLQHGEKLDLREVPSVVGGDEKSRHGIVLAKSLPAKKYGIKTGETLLTARRKCPELISVPPKYELYVKCSNAMLNILNQYTPTIQRFSVDECFMDMTDMNNLYKDYSDLAYEIKDKIKNELGFTVNIGISNNKLLAKVASDLRKPDMVHTLFPDEIREKMWPLPVEDLFMVGRATTEKLYKLNIHTIGELANHDIEVLRSIFKSHGILIWNYANGIEDSVVRKSNFISMKGMGNSTTIPFDVENRTTAHMVLLSLSESVGMRLRNSQNCCRLVAVSIRTNKLETYSKQRKIDFAIDSTKYIANIAYKLFDEVWRGEPIRHLGVSVSELCSNEFNQVSMFDDKDIDKNKAIDTAIDKIRLKYGSNSIVKSIFLHSGIKPVNGGVGEGDYPVMTSIL